MTDRKPLLKGEQPVRVDGYGGTWVVVREEHATNSKGQTFVEVASGGQMLLVASAKVHRGHYEWRDDD